MYYVSHFYDIADKDNRSIEIKEKNLYFKAVFDRDK